MKTIVAILIVLGSLSACSSRVGYIDPQRAIQQTDEWKAVQSDAKAYADARQPDLDAAIASLKKARDAKATAEQILAAETKAGELQQQINAEVKRRLDAGTAKIGAAMNVGLDKFAAAEGVSAVAPAAGAFWIDPRLDLTDRLAKRYNAQAGAASVGEVQSLRDEVKAFKAAQQASPPLAKK